MVEEEEAAHLQKENALYALPHSSVVTEIFHPEGFTGGFHCGPHYCHNSYPARIGLRNRRWTSARGSFQSLLVF